MITTLNNRNVHQIKTINCPVCVRPMKSSKSMDYKKFYYCNHCHAKHSKDKEIILVDIDIYRKDNVVWISTMDIYFGNVNVRQDNMENESEHAMTTIYIVPENPDGTWVEIATFPMLEFDISDPEKFKKKIRTYVTFS